MNKYQEALEFLVKASDCDCKECEECSINKFCYKYEAIQTVQKLVDKKIPKKPIIRCLSGAIYTCVHTCPVCGKELIVTNNETVIYKTKTNYCDECGQRLDWSGINE